MSLEKFMDIVEDESITYYYRAGEIRPLKTRIRHHCIPQTHPYNCLAQANFIGRFENLNDDFSYIAQKIGLTNYSLPKLNASPDQEWMQFFTDDILERCNSYYHDDFTLLGYTKLTLPMSNENSSAIQKSYITVAEEAYGAKMSKVYLIS